MYDGDMTNTNPTTRTTYSVHVTPSFGKGLAPRYVAGIYRIVLDGISGPIGDQDVAFDTLDALDAWILASGFDRFEDFSGEVNVNGFASASIEPLS